MGHVQINWFDLLVNTAPRRKVFVSYHHDEDQAYYDNFSKLDFEYQCITDNSLDRLIDSDKPEYVIQRIKGPVYCG